MISDVAIKNKVQELITNIYHQIVIVPIDVIRRENKLRDYTQMFTGDQHVLTRVKVLWGRRDLKA